MSFCNPACQSVPRGQSEVSAPTAVAGFTLLELMATIAVAGILMAIAVPAFRSFMQSDRLLTESSQLLMSLDYARSEAIKQDTTVEVCASSNGTTCSGNSTDWTNGWIVLGTVAGDAPLQVVKALAAGNSLTEANAQAAVTFDGTGLASTLAVPMQFTLCDARGSSYARYTEVAAFSGRVASSNTIGHDLSGAALTCGS